MDIMDAIAHAYDLEGPTAALRQSLVQSVVSNKADFERLLDLNHSFVVEVSVHLLGRANKADTSKIS